MARRLAFILLGLAIGYSFGFVDGRHHERNIVLRAVERVQGVAENTVGAREKQLKEELDRMQP